MKTHEDTQDLTEMKAALLSIGIAEHARRLRERDYIRSQINSVLKGRNLIITNCK